MYSHTAQWSRLEVVRLVQAGEAARMAGRVRAAARVAGRVAAAVGFAGVMWLLLAGPGFLDGRSSTAEHPTQRMAARGTGR